MSELSDEFSEVAVEQIAEFGEDVVVTLKTATSTDHVDRPLTEEDGPSHELRMAILPFKTELVDGTTIREGDMQGWIAAADAAFDVQEGIKITRKLSGKVWTVLRVTEAALNDAVIAYELHLRGPRKEAVA